MSILATELTVLSWGSITQRSEHTVVACRRIGPGNLLTYSSCFHLPQGHLCLLAIPLIEHGSRDPAGKETHSSSNQCALASSTRCESPETSPRGSAPPILPPVPSALAPGNSHLPFDPDHYQHNRQPNNRKHDNHRAPNFLHPSLPSDFNLPALSP